MLNTVPMHLHREIRKKDDETQAEALVRVTYTQTHLMIAQRAHNGEMTPVEVRAAVQQLNPVRDHYYDGNPDLAMPILVVFIQSLFPVARARAMYPMGTRPFGDSDGTPPPPGGDMGRTQ